MCEFFYTSIAPDGDIIEVFCVQNGLSCKELYDFTCPHKKDERSDTNASKAQRPHETTDTRTKERS